MQMQDTPLGLASHILADQSRGTNRHTYPSAPTATSSPKEVISAERIPTPLDVIRNKMSTSKNERVEAKYDVVLDFPNLELHSAAASGNVGLVHYALTHGQPVNSLLHGCLPLHAACSGGSVSVVRMLIERGADVNAPRLPRRYSDSRRSGTPAVGTAGSTPLHFAAANGHVAIVQILLACGALPDKLDKNGMTPEDLAEISGHGDVIHTLRAWEHLNDIDTSSRQSYENGVTFNRSSLSRASSSTSQRSEPDGLAIKKSMERAGSMTSLASEKGLRLFRSNLEANVWDSGSVPGNDITIEASRSEMASPFHPSAPPSPIAEDEDSSTLSRATTNNSTNTGFQPPMLDSHEDLPHPISPFHPQRSSRRPSLPSIFEKAAHPGAAFRAAIHKSEHSGDTPPGRLLPNPSSSSFFRGRARSNESSESHSFSNATPHARVHQSFRKYSRQSLLHIFRRGHSPPSRSPSPPRKTEATRVIGAEELDEGIARLKRASVDLDKMNTIDLKELGDHLPTAVVSAPPTKTRFFEDAGPASPTSFSVSSDRTPYIPPAVERPWDRRRAGSGVLSPSPLSNEWDLDNDSEIQNIKRGDKRRTMTEVSRINLSLTHLSPSAPVNVGLTKPRSATLPSHSHSALARERDIEGIALDRAGGVGRFHNGAAEKGAHSRTTSLTEMIPDIGMQREGEGEVLENKMAAIPSAVLESSDMLVDIEVSGATLDEQWSQDASIESDAAELSSIATQSEMFHRSVVDQDEVRSVVGSVSVGAAPVTPLESQSEIPISPTLSTSYQTELRPRGKSVSSIASAGSGMDLTYPQNASTPGTSLKPPSLISVVLSSGFPPVPENDIAQSIPPTMQIAHPGIRPPQRTISSHAEARDLVEQNERDVLELAQLPPSIDSSRSLSAQLAAYGESHAIEQRFARARGMSTSTVTASGGSGSDRSSFVSAESFRSSLLSSGTPSARSDRQHKSKTRSLSNPLVEVDTDKSSIPSINNIYDRRAAAYRDRLQTLTMGPSSQPLQSRSVQFDGNRSRSFSTSDMWPPSVPAVGSSPRSSLLRASAANDIDLHPNISSPMPIISSTSSGSRSRKGSRTLTRQPAASLASTLASTSRPLISNGPAQSPTSNLQVRPNADVVSVRYQGLAQARTFTAASPHASIFSSRYSAHPQGDGDDSDDPDERGQAYTVIENDWRSRGVDQSGMKVQGTWGHLKGAIGHLGRR